MHSINDEIFNHILHSDLKEIVQKGCFDGLDLNHLGHICGKFLVQVKSLHTLSLFLSWYTQS